jgi:tRNA modification GTPase
MEDTIFALSSGSNNQATALAVIRMTGPATPSFLQTLTLGKPLPKPRIATLRKLYQGTNQSKQHMLDQALVLYFPGPASFTGEDVVELHCHGSRAVVDGVLKELASCGGRLAEPGEFTQRAFSAGKLGLLETEALADLLVADTALQRQQALNQLDGNLSKTYQDWRERLIGGLAHAEAVIDFGDDERLNDDDESDDGMRVWGNVEENMRNLRESMQRELSNERGELVRQGVQIAIVGPPNAGKSSLFNILANRPAAIVSSTAGTTRDVLEISLNLGGCKCILQDTAGVRDETNDEIEKEGMKRAAFAASQADFIVAMIDSTDSQAGLDSLQSILMDPTHKENDVMLVLNKADLEQSLSSTMIVDARWKNFEMSCETQQGVDDFLEALTSRVMARVSGQSMGDDKLDGAPLITRARHRQHVLAAVEALERFEMQSQSLMGVDLAAEELRLASSELGRILGAIDVEDVLDKLFADFCIGK